MNTTVDNRDKRPIAPTAYRDFINGIDISDIHLVSAKIDSYSRMDETDNCKVTWGQTASYKNSNKLLEISHEYRLNVTDSKTRKSIVKLKVVFSVVFTSNIPMNDEFFEIFREYNLPLNTWPYFREFVQNTFARMNWIGLIAPLYKRVTGESKVKSYHGSIKTKR